MSMAVNDIIATGGNKIDDATLISMMENALPPAYAAIRQTLRYHATERIASSHLVSGDVHSGFG